MPTIVTFKENNFTNIGTGIETLEYCCILYNDFLYKNMTNDSYRKLLYKYRGSYYDTKEKALKYIQSSINEINTIEMRKKKQLAKLEEIIETQKALPIIEVYKSILLNGIKNINTLSINLEKLTKENINNFIKYILNSSKYPEDYKKEFEVKYDENSKIFIVNYKIPKTNEVPNVVKYKYDEVLDNLTSIEMKDKDFNKYYESIIFQITLRTIYEVFIISRNDLIQSIVFNGWIDDIDRKTGNNFSSCIISLMVNREKFEKINLTQICLKDCILYLKGIISGSLHNNAPVKPIMDIDKSDKRFIESKEILSKLNEGTNLAEMYWEDFEYLVRELFEKIFSNDGSEVKVTQASRDGGVDAIAFDNDPIRGGKFIIQAKRYNNVVPVSAVRDLYGTVINEGAVKGILVTTSYYGNDSRDFVKDKPISLIDGSNLVYLLNEYGYKAYIELKKN